jgi:hypothetical protein
MSSRAVLFVEGNVFLDYKNEHKNKETVFGDLNKLKHVFITFEI